MIRFALGFTLAAIIGATWSINLSNSMNDLGREIHELRRDLSGMIEYTDTGLRLQKAVMTLAENREGR